MINWGEVPAGSVLPFFFDSFAGSTGASVTLTGLAVTDIEVYKGTSMTQRASDAGYTLLDTDGIDLDGVTGIHGFSIDLGDNTDAGFYAAGSFYTVVVSAVTIDSQTVNFVAATFRIKAAEAIAGKPKVDVDAFGGSAGTFSGGRPEVNATHWGGTAIASANVRANLVQILGTAPTESGAGRLAAAFTTFYDVATPVLTTAGVNQTGDSYARIGATGSGLTSLASAANLAIVAGYVDTEIGTLQTTADAIKVKTDNLPASPAAVGSAMTLTSGERTSVADAILDRDMSTGTDSGSTTVRTPRQALRAIRNKSAVAAGTLTVYKEDDATASWTAAVTGTAGADPITAIDPAGP